MVWSEKVKKRKSAEKSHAEISGLHVGTSGWNYGGWSTIFYPEEIKSTYSQLSFYARHFDTVEVNYSFYHLPGPETYKKWAKAVPPKFIFAIKASRFITHIKRLRDVEEPWRQFIANARTLGEQLGPILFQLPPGFKADEKRLSGFLDLISNNAPPVHPVFEFRHQSWFTEAIYSILKKAGATLCIAHSARYPCLEEITSHLVYYRFHGPQGLFASRYSDEELKVWTKKIRPLLKDGKKVFIYFNNDFNGYAIENAGTIRRLIEGE